MKTIAKAFGLASLGSLLIAPGFAQVTETTETTQTTEHADGSVTEKKTTTTRTFDPVVQKRVTTYFDPYKAERYGLPPEVAARISIEKMPAAWRTTAIAPGVVVREPEREYLVDAPPQLVKLLPPVETTKVRYYVAGGNVVAVDPEYRVVDSIRIPSVKFVVDTE